ncbi:hypothetical protein [Mesorhizobium sp. M7A.F.Ca.ET.027.03.2.1]|uniref:hypothetical protein n=1 Tax=Mesorhizobium sp. M7A.F.Ca.ET.027.03.2.1 TaxID=2496656 RepID=UPI000FCB95B1|nr:hypothetical protein [Mesorhizobium sp. M7A.F.Ca.ET.027.03.2.1]RVD66403.1 hypothetical protein EN750_03565 [Mesorhizobium sp. M7A.F.Ca.ET.027.03.2.1]
MPFLIPIIAPLASAVGLGGFASWLGGSTILAGLARFGIGLAAKYALGAIFGQQEPQAQAVQLDTVYGEDLARTVGLGVYGTAGQKLYRNAYGSGNRSIQDVYKLSDFRITGITRVRAEGEWRSLGGIEDPVKGFRVQGIDGEIWVKVYLGTMDQVADAGLIDEANPPGRWSEDHRGAGIAYAVVTMQLDREKMQQPWEAFFEVQGAPLYDWRKDSTVGGSGAHRWNDQDTWEFSENPVLMVYGLERGFFNGTEMMVGKGVPAGRLPLGEWTLAANVCDESIGLLKRYSAGVIAAAGSGVTHDQNIQPLFESCAATWIEDASGEFPIVGAAQSTVFTFTDADIMVDETFRFSTKRTKSELINTLAGTFRDPDAFFEQTPFAVRIDEVALAEDGERLAVAIPYGAVNKAEVADRLADIAFKASRFQGNGDVVIHPMFLADAKVGRWCEWDSAEFGTRKFQILEKTLGPLGDKGARNIHLKLQEVGDEIFDGTDYTTVPPVPELPGPPDYQTEAANFLAFGVAQQVTGSAEKIPGLRFTWNAFTDITVVSVDIEYRPQGQTDSIVKRANVPDQVLITSDGVLAATTYEYRHRIITRPVRTTFFTDWATVSTPAATVPAVSVGLGQLQQDVYQELANLRGEITDTFSRLNDLAAAVVDASGRVAKDNSVAVRFRNATAVALRTMTASIEETEAGLEAQAEILDAVQATVGDASSGILWRMRAVAGTGDVVAQVVLDIRATAGDAFAAAGTLWEAGFVGGDPLQPFSRMVVNVGSFIVTDGTDTGTPLVFEDGELKLQVARIGTAIVEVLQSANNKLVITGHDDEAKIELFA